MAYTIRYELCSACHRCRMECPVSAIRFREGHYWIDPEKCISCGTCQSVCHNGCISDPDAPAPAITPHDTIRKDCDICVIGAGASGLVAAARAADMGARVLVLEKNHEIGGSAWYASGFIVHYSKLHEAAGIPDEREKSYREFMEVTGGKVDGELVQRLFRANSDWIDWLIDRHNFTDYYGFDPNDGRKTPFGAKRVNQKEFVPWSDRRIDEMIGPGAGGWLITTKMLEVFQKAGGEIFYNTPAVELKTNDAGDVIGVLAKDAGGLIDVSCKAVIVAAGAFSRNREIMQKMQPLFFGGPDDEPIHIFTCSTCTGDGLTMCEAIGADIDYENRRVNIFGPKRHPYPAASLHIGNGPMFRTDGRRHPSGFDNHEVSGIIDVPGRCLWEITTEANAKAAIEAKAAQSKGSPNADLSGFLANWKQVLREEEEDGSLFIADTLEELAEKLSMDVQMLRDGIADFNREIAEAPPADPFLAFMLGPTAPIGEEGPFYAVKQKLFHENAVGGMKIDGKTRVLRKGTPIPGLYAVGDNTRGIMLPGDIGVRYIELTFSALTFAFNSGYIAAEEACAFAGI